MKVDFVNPFLVAGMRVLQDEFQIEVEMGKPDLVTTTATLHPVNVVIHVHGSIQGMAIYAMDLPTAKRLIRQMTGQPVSIFDELGNSALRELANIITGLASVGLEQAGYPSQISVPAIILGTGVQIMPGSVPMITVPIQTSVGELRLYLTLSEAS